ncbi:thiolase family protein [Acidianus brierleyi]|uniref:Acetyl-CoA synthetase n=1 Tax=Acidianus brierleyi TaxID=41673 RepID=A0A2U9IFV5_9CREN|nr:thiolase family protein [Acidianus brierleyi]AWR94921.1 thiolase family protein [Acidianus brierleyi]
MSVNIASYSMLKVDRYYETNLTNLSVAAAKEIIENLKDSFKPDILIFANSYSEKTSNQVLLSTKLTNILGYSVPSFRIENGDASGGAAIFTAYNLIKSGEIKSALIIGSEKLSDFPSNYLNEILTENMDEEFSERLGILPQSFAALQMKTYMKKYNVDYDYFSNWPYFMHKYGSENPYAYLKFAVDKKTILDSQLISEPMRLFDTAPRADGAAAILVTNDEIARKLTDSPVKISKVTSSTADIKIGEIPSLKEAYNKLGKFNPDLIEIHDSYSIYAALILEELGFTKGKSLSELDNLPINYSGGLKSRGYPGGATGIYQIAEATMQLLGNFPGKRVPSSEKALVISMDDLGNTTYLTQLTR